MTKAPSQPRPRKRFGQNFLTDPGIIDRIVARVAPSAGEALVEIGPGRGAITAPLLEAAGRLDAVELDRDMAALLRRRFGNHPGFTLHETDVLEFDFSMLPRPPERRRVVGNLPYNISTPLIFHLLAQHDRIADIVVMLQLEVVDRLTAGPGSKDYGRLGLMVQYRCRIEKLFEVPPGAFSPAPKVRSAVVRLTPHDTLPHPARDFPTLERVVRQAFSQRRKTIRNNLKSMICAADLEALGIDPDLRPENLSLEDYVRISNSQR